MSSIAKPSDIVASTERGTTTTAPSDPTVVAIPGSAADASAGADAASAHVDAQGTAAGGTFLQKLEDVAKPVSMDAGRLFVVLWTIH